MWLGSSKHRLLTLGAIVVVISAVLWRAPSAITRWNQRQLAYQIAHGVEQGVDRGNAEAAAEPLRRLASFGTSALEPLVIVAASQRPEVGRQARRIVDEQFAAWQVRSQTDEDFDLSKQTTALAATLLSHADEFDPQGRRWVEGLAIRMIELTKTLEAADAARLLDVCDLLLGSIPPNGPRLRTLPETAQSQLLAAPSKLGVPEIPIELLAVPSESSRSVFAGSEKGTGNIRQDIVSDSSAEQDATATEASGNSAGQLTSTDPWSPAWGPPLNPEETSSAPGMQLEVSVAPDLHQSAATANKVVEVPTPQEMKRRQQAMRKLSSRILLSQLPEANHYVAGSIRQVLRERGFADAEMELAKQLTSAHMEDRIQLVEAVATLPAEHARRWLRWLLEDEDASVRLRALAILATTNDPQLFQLARELAITDQDDRVSALASRIVSLR